MKYILTTTLMIFASVVAFGGNDDLQKAPQGDVHVVVKHKKTVAEYCPDNTCSGVKILKGKKEDAEKYLYLYLFSQSEYIYLPKWKADTKTEVFIKDILKQLNNKKCKSSNIVSEADCVLASKIKDKSIGLYSSRADEGKEIESAIKLKKK